MSLLFARDVSFLGKFTLCCIAWNINYICTAVNQFWQGPEQKTALPHTSKWLCLPAGQLIGPGCAVCSLFWVCSSQRDSVYCRVSIKWEMVRIFIILPFFLGCLLNQVESQGHCKILSKSIWSPVDFTDFLNEVRQSSEQHLGRVWWYELELLDFISAFLCACVLIRD